MGRRLRTQLLALAKALAPRDLKREREEVVKKEEIYRSNQTQSFNQQHQAKELPDLANGDSVWIRDQDRLGKIQGRIQHPRSFVIETEKGTLRCNRSGLVEAEWQSPSKVDKQATSTSTASNHAVQDTEEMSGLSKFPCTTTEAPMQLVPSQTAPLAPLINWTSKQICLTLSGQFWRQLLHLCPLETVICTIKSCECLAVRF